MRVTPHSHPCLDCKEPLECGGTFEQMDPDVHSSRGVCPEYENYKHDWRCVACQIQRDAEDDESTATV